MENIFSLFAQHGLLAVFLGVFVEQMGAPVPALPFLLLAGVAGANDGVFAVEALIVATLASMMADSMWFFAGQRFGRRVLGLLCRLSLSPDNCPHAEAKGLSVRILQGGVDAWSEAGFPLEPGQTAVQAKSAQYGSGRTNAVKPQRDDGPIYARSLLWHSNQGMNDDEAH